MLNLPPTYAGAAKKPTQDRQQFVYNPTDWTLSTSLETNLYWNMHVTVSLRKEGALAIFHITFECQDTHSAEHDAAGLAKLRFFYNDNGKFTYHTSTGFAAEDIKIIKDKIRSLKQEGINDEDIEHLFAEEFTRCREIADDIAVSFIEVAKTQHDIGPKPIIEVSEAAKKYDTEIDQARAKQIEKNKQDKQKGKEKFQENPNLKKTDEKASATEGKSIPTKSKPMKINISADWQPAATTDTQEPVASIPKKPMLKTATSESSPSQPANPSNSSKPVTSNLAFAPRQVQRRQTVPQTKKSSLLSKTLPETSKDDLEATSTEGFFKPQSSMLNQFKLSKETSTAKPTNSSPDPHSNAGKSSTTNPEPSENPENPPSPTDSSSSSESSTSSNPRKINKSGSSSRGRGSN